MNIRWVHRVHGKNVVLAANHAELALGVHEFGQILIQNSISTKFYLLNFIYSLRSIFVLA